MRAPGVNAFPEDAEDGLPNTAAPGVNAFPNSRRGAALIVAVVFAVLLALIAESLSFLAHSRIRLYTQTRDRQRSQLAAETALSELSYCVSDNAYPLPAKCKDAGGKIKWSWGCNKSTRSCTTERILTIGTIDNNITSSFRITGKWTEGSNLEVEVTPL